MGYSFSPHLKKRTTSLTSFGKNVWYWFADSACFFKKILLSFFPDHLSLILMRARIRTALRFSSNYVRKIAVLMTKGVKKYRNVLMLFILVVVFGASIFYGLSQKRLNEDRIKELTSVKELESRIEEAGSLAKLNPVKSKSILDQVQTDLENWALSSSARASLHLKLEQVSPGSFKSLAESDFHTVVQFGDQVSSFGSGIISVGEHVYVFDQLSGSLWDVRGSNSTKVVSDSPELKSMINVFSSGGSVFVLAKTGIYQLVPGSSTLTKIIDSDPQWGALVQGSSYAGTNIYILDGDKNAIWKYSSSGSSWSAKRNYLVKQNSFDLHSSVSIGVDGSVWVLFDDGGIVKFTKGVREDFTVSGLPSPIGKGSTLLSSETLTNLYIFDKVNTQVIVINKLGNFLTQYSGAPLGRTTSWSVNEKEGKAYFTVDQKLVTLELRK